MKKQLCLLTVLLTPLFLLACSSAKKRAIHPARPGDLSYKQLMLLDYDQMTKAVRREVQMARQQLRSDDDPEATASAFLELKKALRLIFSRPDNDNMVAKLVPEVRRELALYDAYGKIIRELGQEGIQAFDPDLGVNTLTLATYTFMLQNMMGEIKTEARLNASLRETIQMIADAHLEIPEDVIRERKITGMFLTESPSEQAHRILEQMKASQK
jgi:hypothetical protein